MKLRDEYPIYMNPTDNELVEIAESNWDTLRVLESEDTILIGSGYGNTHETLAHYHRIITKKKYPPILDPLIFFHDRTGIMLANLEDISGSRYAMPNEWKKVVYHEEMICTIAELSGLRHD